MARHDVNNRPGQLQWRHRRLYFPTPNSELSISCSTLLPYPLLTDSSLYFLPLDAPPSAIGPREKSLWTTNRGQPVGISPSNQALLRPWNINNRFNRDGIKLCRWRFPFPRPENQIDQIFYFHLNIFLVIRLVNRKKSIIGSWITEDTEEWSRKICFYFSFTIFISFFFIAEIRTVTFTKIARNNVFKIIRCLVRWSIPFNYYVKREFSSRQLRRVGALFNFRLVTQT